MKNIVTCTKPHEGRIYSETFYREDYFSDWDLHKATMLFCKNSVDLGWNVEAINGDSRIIFIEKGVCDA